MLYQLGQMVVLSPFLFTRPFTLFLKASVEKAEEELERLHALLQCKTIDYKTGAAHTADGTDRQGDECRVAKLVRRRESKV
jgi:CMP-2-keto-3-deoxyoctulosonic acid synthetase